jgi:hypothetical protein
MRFRVEYAVTGRRKCNVTNVEIAQDRPPIFAGGVAVPITWSLAGLTERLSRDDRGVLRRVADRGVDGLTLLRPAD